jgi:hypothetical protein
MLLPLLQDAFASRLPRAHGNHDGKLSNQIDYTLDLAGNRVKEDVKAPSAAAWTPWVGCNKPAAVELHREDGTMKSLPKRFPLWAVALASASALGVDLAMGARSMVGH